MSATDVSTHVIQCDSDAEYETAKVQLDAYVAQNREPPILFRVDNPGKRRITIVQESVVDLVN